MLDRVPPYRPCFLLIYQRKRLRHPAHTTNLGTLKAYPTLTITSNPTHQHQLA